MEITRISLYSRFSREENSNKSYYYKNCLSKHTVRSHSYNFIQDHNNFNKSLLIGSNLKPRLPSRYCLKEGVEDRSNHHPIFSIEKSVDRIILDL